jgi:hypothetical protein
MIEHVVVSSGSSNEALTLAFLSLQTEVERRGFPLNQHLLDENLHPILNEEDIEGFHLHSGEWWSSVGR